MDSWGDVHSRLSSDSRLSSIRCRHTVPCFVPSSLACAAKRSCLCSSTTPYCSRTCGSCTVMYQTTASPQCYVLRQASTLNITDQEQMHIVWNNYTHN